MSDAIIHITPEILLILVATVMYVMAAFVTARRTWFWISIASLLVAAGLAIGLLVAGPQGEHSVRAGVFPDAFAHMLRGLTLLSGILIVLLGRERQASPMAGEYFGSLLIATAGLSLVATASNLVLLFAALELVSIPTYLLLYIGRRDAAAREAAAKYFYLSVLASAVFLFGAALIYGLTGTTNLEDIRGVLSDPRRLAIPAPVIGALGLVLLLGGLTYKMTAVPFHFYAPDVYQGTTNVMAAFLSWFPKAAGFVAALRLFAFALRDPLGPDSTWLLWVFSVVTMCVGNMLALLQRNVRRLFAYSSIAHSGYMLLGLGAACYGAPPGAAFSGTESVMLYLIAYLFMTTGFFAVVIWLSREDQKIESIDDFAGLAEAHPIPTAFAALFLFSLTGLPFTFGFWGKFAVFYSALASRDPRYVLATVVGVITAAMGAYYYLRIVMLMYLHRGYTRLSFRYADPAFAVVVICAIGTLLGGIWPAAGVWLARPAAGVIEPRLAAPQAAVMDEPQRGPALSALERTVAPRTSD